MLGLKSFRSAAVTLAGVELAHRIRKGQHLLPIKLEGRRPLLKEMWECALNPASKSVLPDGCCIPPMHQISRRTKRDCSEEFLKSEFPPVRYLRKFAFGGNLNLFVTPKGGRYWRYCYRYGGKRRTLSLGIYPEVPVDRARSRHLAARQLLAAVLTILKARRITRELSTETRLSSTGCGEFSRLRGCNCLQRHLPVRRDLR